MAQRLLRHRRPHVQFERVGSSSCHQASVARAHSWVLFAAMRPNARRAQPHHLRLLASARQNQDRERADASQASPHRGMLQAGVQSHQLRHEIRLRIAAAAAALVTAKPSDPLSQPGRSSLAVRQTNSKAMDQNSDQNGRPSKFGGPLSRLCRENEKLNLCCEQMLAFSNLPITRHLR